MPNAAELWKKFQQCDGIRPRAVRRFTDRQDFRRAYYDLVNKAFAECFNDCYIINYHGVGGAGKSALLRRLEEELLRDADLPEDEARAACEAARRNLRQPGRRNKPAVLRADFDDAGLNSVESVLFRFRAQLLRQNDKAVFPLFDVAMLRLSQKYGRRLPPDEQKEMITDNPVVSFALDVVGDLTGAGLVIGAAQTVVKVSQDVIRAITTRKSAIRKANEEIARMDASQLERRLPYYFAMDVNAMGLPLVCVYLDTYEKMTAQAEGAGRTAGFDEEWLRGELGLVRNLGNAVFAIAGREQLAWNDPPFEKRYIEALSRTDSVNFLASCGIRDEALCARLYQLTGGEPVYLDLCVDEYEKMLDDKRTDIDIKDFGEDLDRLVERHTRYIPSNLRDALYLLAAMGRWSDELCEGLCRTLPIPSTVGSDYFLLTHMSYVRRDGDEWVMHRPVAQVLAKELRPALADRLVTALAGQVREAAGKLHGDDALRNMGSQALELLDRLPLTGSAAPSAIRAMEIWAGAVCGEHRCPEAIRWQARAVELWQDLGHGYEANYAGSLAGKADILREQLWNRPSGTKLEAGPDAERERALMARRGWEELRDFCAASIAVCKELGDAADGALVRLWERKAQAEDELEDWGSAVDSWLCVMELGRNLGKPERFWRGAQFRAGWDRQQWPVSDWEGSRALLQDALTAFSRLDTEEGRPFSPRTVLTAVQLRDAYDELGDRWEEPRNRLVEWLGSLNCTLTGKETLEELWDWYDWALTAPGELAPIIAGLEKELGPLHPRVLMAKAALVNRYVSQKASAGFQEGLKEYGDGYFASITEDGPIGRTPAPRFCCLERPDEVLGTCRELVELYTMALGREDPGTYNALYTLAFALYQADRPEESIPIWQELLTHYDRMDGPGNRESLSVIHYLVEDCCRCGRWDDAVYVQERRLELMRDKASGEALDSARYRTCRLVLSRLWQDDNLTLSQAQDCANALLELTGDMGPHDRRMYLESALQWCRERPEDVPNEAKERLVLALADSGTARSDVIGLLEPYAQDASCPLLFRAGVLLRLGRALRDERGADSAARSVELLEDLKKLLEKEPGLTELDRGTVMLELGLARGRVGRDLTDEEARQRNRQAMMDALRESLAWRESHLKPDDPAVDEARYELAQRILTEYLPKKYRHLRREAVPLLEQVLAFRRSRSADAQAIADAELSMVEALALEDGRLEDARALYREAKERIKRQHLGDHNFRAPYLLYRAAGGKLQIKEWIDAGEPEHD